MATLLLPQLPLNGTPSHSQKNQPNILIAFSYAEFSEMIKSVNAQSDGAQNNPFKAPELVRFILLDFILPLTTLNE